MNPDACVHYWEGEHWSAQSYGVLEDVTKAGASGLELGSRRHGRGIKCWRALTWETVRVEQYALSLMPW